MKKEVWKAVVGFEGFYEVSDRGRVRSVARKLNAPHGRVIDFKGVIKKIHSGKHGYLHTAFYVHGKMTLVKLHRLIAMAFIPNPDNKPQVNHKNCIKTDNRIENLEWCTGLENTRHARLNGRFPRPVYSGALDGEKCYKTKTDTKTVLKIRDEWAKGAKAKDLSLKYKMNLSTLCHIVYGRSWKHLLPK